MLGSYHNKWTENALTRKVEVLDQGRYALPSLHTQMPEKSPMLVSTPGELYWPTMVVESGRSEGRARLERDASLPQQRFELSTVIYKPPSRVPRAHPRLE